MQTVRAFRGATVAAPSRCAALVADGAVHVPGGSRIGPPRCPIPRTEPHIGPLVVQGHHAPHAEARHPAH